MVIFVCIVAADTPPAKKMKLDQTVPTSSNLLPLGSLSGSGVTTDTSKMPTSSSVGMPSSSSTPVTQVCVCMHVIFVFLLFVLCCVSSSQV